MFAFLPHSELKGMKGHRLLHWPLTEGVYNIDPLQFYYHEGIKLISNPGECKEKAQKPSA